MSNYTRQIKNIMDSLEATHGADSEERGGWTSSPAPAQRYGGCKGVACYPYHLDGDHFPTISELEEKHRKAEAAESALLAGAKWILFVVIALGAIITIDKAIAHAAALSCGAC